MDAKVDAVRPTVQGSQAKGWFRCQFHLILACVFFSLFGLETLVFAEVIAPLESFEGRYRLGVELEITPRFFSLGIHLFDFDRYQAELGQSEGWSMLAGEIPAPWIDDYLVSEEMLNDLPTEIRQALLNGLDAYRPIVTQGRVELPQAVRPRTREGGTDSTRLSASGQVSAGQGVILSGPSEPSGGSNSRLVGISGAPPSTPGLVLSDSTRQGARWSEIQRRWRALPVQQRAGAIRLSRLPASRLAELCVRTHEFGLPPIDISRVHLKSDLPASVLAAFANWEWVQDGRTVEFRMSSPLTSPREVIRQTLTIARLFRVERYRGLEGTTDRGVPFGDESPSIHLHQSRQDWGSLRAAVEVENLFRLVQGLELGEDVLRAVGSVYYRDSIDIRGLVRLVGRDSTNSGSHPRDSRKESRYFQGTLENEIARILSLNERPDHFFEATLRRLTPAMLDQIFRAPDQGAERFAGNLAGILESCANCAVLPELQTALNSLLPRLLSHRSRLHSQLEGLPSRIARIVVAALPRSQNGLPVSLPSWATQEFLSGLMVRVIADGDGDAAGFLLRSSQAMNESVLAEVLRTEPTALSDRDKTIWFFEIRPALLSAESRLIYLRRFVDHYVASSERALEPYRFTEYLQRAPSLTTEEAEILAPLINQSSKFSTRVRSLITLLGRATVLGPRAQAEAERLLNGYTANLDLHALRDALERSRRASASGQGTGATERQPGEPTGAVGGAGAGGGAGCESLQEQNRRMRDR